MNDFIHDDEEEKIRVEVVGAFFFKSLLYVDDVFVLRARVLHTVSFSLYSFCVPKFSNDWISSLFSLWYSM